ncbi:helix-turn-helix domain-containing protein [Actinomadura geliboluensis]|uniref:helix-turn-helix domain-containing protein n=1 Tax=Actinomadura geliboluensis TaxID=882440 RepID=UPI0037150AA6
MGATDQEDLLDVEGTARLLKISVRGVYRLAAEGELPCFRVGRQLRFDRGEVLDAVRTPAAGRSA